MSALGFAAVWVGLSLGNFLYQMLASELWSVAVERSFFQGTAIITVAVAWKLSGILNGATRRSFP